VKLMDDEQTRQINEAISHGLRETENHMAGLSGAVIVIAMTSDGQMGVVSSLGDRTDISRALQVAVEKMKGN
jgi:hypothetical protein